MYLRRKLIPPRPAAPKPKAPKTEWKAIMEKRIYDHFVGLWSEWERIEIGEYVRLSRTPHLNTFQVRRRRVGITAAEEHSNG